MGTGVFRFDPGYGELNGAMGGVKGDLFRGSVVLPVRIGRLSGGEQVLDMYRRLGNRGGDGDAVGGGSAK